MAHNKKELIKKIKSIIARVGMTTAADMQMDTSPVWKSVGKDHHLLIERFAHKFATVTTYIHELETDNSDIYYEDIDNETLRYILSSLKKYEKELQLA